MKIYVIMVMTQYKMDNKGFPDFGDTTLVGYYIDKEKAFEAVLYNYADIWETCYDYAIIEEVEEGLYPCSTIRWFFKYNHNDEKYQEIEELPGLNKFCGLII